MAEREIIKLTIDDDVDRQKLFGNLDANIKRVEHATGTSILLRDGDMSIEGNNAAIAENIIKELIEVLRNGEEIDPQRLSYIVDMNLDGRSASMQVTSKDIICYTYQGRPLRPKTAGQKEYVENIRKHDMTFGIGPAGTGKTYLACALAVNAYKNKEVEKIILARPAVEAGESLGFLPGDLQEKVDPYLRPLYDALNEIMGPDTAARLRENGTVEIVPLAYMRGRTLDNAFIILDEAQNTTREQMKMFLTRMGFNSKVVVTGDVTQIDLPKGKGSGLVEACRVLANVEGIAFSQLTDVDVVRHDLVKRIIKAYNDYDRESGRRNAERTRSGK